MTGKIEKKKDDYSVRFTNRVIDIFNAGNNDIKLSDFQKRLIQNYFICIDATLKKSESKRNAQKNGLEYAWNNVNMELLASGNYVENAAAMGEILIPELHRIRAKYPDILGCVQGKGLVAGIQVVKAGTKEPDSATAVAVNLKCLQKGLLMFAPVGIGGECLKIAPPLTITEDALRESLAVFEESIDEVLG